MIKYKILLDASNLSLGGGVQVGLALIHNFINDDAFEIICIASPQIDQQLNIIQKQKIKYYFVENNESIIGKYNQGKRIAEIEKKYNPNLTFIIFGPSYWKPKSVSIQGFALGKMIYADELKIGMLEIGLNFVKKMFFLWSDSFLIVETELVKNKLIKFFNYSSDKIFVIGNSYSPAFESYINKNAINSKISTCFRILVPGSFYPHKNLERIIKALALIDKNKIELKMIFTIPEDSEGWRYLSTLAEKMNVIELIETVGFIENSKFARLYQECGAVICASLVESSTAVFPEAFLAKRPLLVSDRPFATELCEDAAIYFDPLSEHSIADAIFKLATNDMLRKELVKKGVKVLEKNYPSAKSKWLMQKELIIKLINESK